MYIYFTHYFLNRSTFHTDGLLFARPKLSSYHGMYQQSSLHKWLHIFCKIKLWGTKTMVNTCKERSLSYVFIVGQAKTCRTFLFGLSMYDFLDSILTLSKFYVYVQTYFGQFQKILDQTRDIHIECSKQFKWNSYFHVSGQSWPFWAALKLL